MAKYFGTDVFRGEANVTLTVEHAYKIGRFIGWYYGKSRLDKRSKIVIGKDTRRSSYMFEYALASGLTASGTDAYLLHVTTTPSVSYVSAPEIGLHNCAFHSHNRYYDNGTKLIRPALCKMEEEVLLQIEDYLWKERGAFATREIMAGKMADHDWKKSVYWLNHFPGNPFPIRV